jgi:hypothetical protein
MSIERLDGFTADGYGNVISGDIQEGDVIRINGTIERRYYATPAPADPKPRVLSKTAFQDYAISQLGGVPDGMARFTTIMDATRDSVSGAVRFAFARYEAAQTFEKENTATLTAIMAADSQTGHITTDERTAIIENWPEA